MIDSTLMPRASHNSRTRAGGMPSSISTPFRSLRISMASVFNARARSMKAGSDRRGATIRFKAKRRGLFIVVLPPAVIQKRVIEQSAC
ncbi:hypothetical protein D9M70_604720 [compost metagenome]